MTEKLNLAEVTLVISQETILNNISLSLPKEGIIGLLGRNGSGKTTLLSLIAAFRMQTSGSITIDGAEVFENETNMAQVMFTYKRDWSEETETVLEYVNRASTYRKEFDREHALNLLDRFGLKHEQAIHEMSNGMQSALAVSVGLASRAPVTIFDEAYAGMDAPTRELFYEEILNEQANHPRLIILSTHLISEMEYLFDQVIILQEGKILLAENYGELLDKGSYVTGMADEVDALTEAYQVLSTKQMGNMKAAAVYGIDAEALQQENRFTTIDISPLPLQTLFNHLTEKGES